MNPEHKSLEFLKTLAELVEDDPACTCCQWAVDEIERLRKIVNEIPPLIELVADDCGVEYINRPSLYQRGTKWRYHKVRAGNKWNDGDTPLSAVKGLEERK